MMEPRYAKSGQRIAAEEIDRAHDEDIALQCGKDSAPWPRVQNDPEFKRGTALSNRRERVLREIEDLIYAGGTPATLLQALEDYFQVKESRDED